MKITIETNLWNETRQKYQCFRHAVKSALEGNNIEIHLKDHKVGENGCEFDCQREKVNGE